MNIKDLQQIKVIVESALEKQDKRNKKKFATKDDIMAMKDEILYEVGDFGSQILEAVNGSKIDRREFEQLKHDVESLKN